MAKRCDRVGICRNRLCLCKAFLEVAMIFFGVCFVVPASFAQSPAQSNEFLSIDCGNTKLNYTDINQVQWVADDGSHITTGSSTEQIFDNASVGGNQALRSFRYFPERRSKYCYEFLLDSDLSYLIRVSFYMNGSILIASRPFEFVVSIDGNDWFTLSSGYDSSQSSLLVVQEGIFYPTREVTSICLRPVVGQPFISSLESRRLQNPILYSYDGSTSQYLTLTLRYNAGASPTAPDVRYPDDPFDRIWKSPDVSLAESLQAISSPEAPDNTNSFDSYYVPPKVMRDAWLFPADKKAEFSFQFYSYGPQVYMNPGQYMFPLVYSEDLNRTASIYDYEIAFQMDGSDFGYISSYNNFSQTACMLQLPFIDVGSLHVVNPGPSFANISVFLISNSITGISDGRVPTINAIEIYIQHNFNFSITNPDDVQIIGGLKTIFSLTNWQGDPCVPVPHDWLSCSLFESTWNPTYYVTSINIANQNISGSTNLTALPNGTLISLTKMNITNSGVDDSTFQFLMNSSPTMLNLSQNAITSLPITSENATTQDLVILDLSHNQLEGDISALDNWIQGNVNLEELYISYNNLTGVFSKSLYFSNLPNLQIGKFDHNMIGGTLDLSVWYDALQQASKDVASNQRTTAVALPLFSFVNNNILDIIPTAETFESSIQNLLLQNKESGVL
ncbi:unnamed protein product [Calypogeia fissa]